MMKNTCVVLGAGFSKAIANFPLTKEMIPAFKKEIEKQNLLDQKSNTVKRGIRLLSFINKIEKDFLKNIYEKADKSGKILRSNYIENFEGLCSFIDLNLAFELNALSEVNGEESDLSGKSLFSPYTIDSLKDARANIGHFLFLTLIKDNINEELLNKIFDNLFKNCTSILTFNYDLILEKFLFKKKYWLPKDGYGFSLKELPEINSVYSNQLSKIQIYKMHGSINWDPADEFFRPHLKLTWFDDDNNFFFPGYLKMEEKRNWKYKGLHPPRGWILPSWVKQFLFDEMVQVWNKAFSSLYHSDEIIFIGYSLPKADSAVYSLFSAIDWSNKKVTLIDPFANELLKNYSFILRKSDIEPIPMTLEDYFLK